MRRLRSALLASAFGLSGLVSGPAWAVVPNDNLLGIHPDGSVDESGVLDAGVTGVGVIYFQSEAGGSICTTSLINPRTAILAAHCVNRVPDEDWGVNTRAAVSFLEDGLPGVQGWAAAGGSRPDLSTYQVLDVVFDARSLALPEDDGGYKQADVALVALDTPAIDVPTWKLLFSPLEGPTEVVFTGYGNTGSGTDGAGREEDGLLRRTVTNSIDVLASPLDIAQAVYLLSGQQIPDTYDSFTADVYIYDFDNPSGERIGYDGAPYANLGGEATAREGSVAPGDSGGPLIVPGLGDGRVLAGVVSGGLFYPNESVDVTYGQFAFYQPLSNYWDWIVDNNFYRYVGAKAGDGDWFDPAHWAERLDPAYQVLVGGRLVNGLPDVPAQGASGAGANFGQVCIEGGGCLDMADANNPVTDTPRFPDSGPGASGFVPNNGFQGPNGAVRFYDVTLSEAGTTRLSGQAQIDALTVTGGARLDIAGGATLALAIGTETYGGWIDVDGLLQTPTFSGAAGLLTGSGRVRAYSFESAMGVGPGGFGEVGTLTLQTDARLAAENVLQIDVGRGGADRLAVIADPEAAQNSTGGLILGGLLVLNPLAADRPRAGDRFTIVSAEGGFLGDFGGVADLPGVLRGELIYSPTALELLIEAGLYADIADLSDASQAPYARLLDAARGPADGPLAGLYDGFDFLEGDALSAGLRSLAPLGLQNAEVLGRLQTESVARALADRAPLGVKNAGAFVAYGQGRGDGLSQAFDAKTQIESEWLVGGGEARLGQATLGGALAYARGDLALPTPEAESESKLWQALAFGRLEGAARPWTLEASVGIGRQDLEFRRAFTAGGLAYAAAGDTEADLYTATVAGAWDLPLDANLKLVPQASLRAARFEVDGFTEAGGPAALRVDGFTADSVQGRVGVGLEGRLPVASGKLSVRGRLALAHEFAEAPDAAIAFAANGAARIAAGFPARDEDWREAGLAVAYEDGPLALTLAAEADLGRDEAEAVDVSLRAAWRF